MRLTCSTISTHRVTFADGALGERRRFLMPERAVHADFQHGGKFVGAAEPQAGAVGEAEHKVVLGLTGKAGDRLAEGALQAHFRVAGQGAGDGCVDIRHEKLLYQMNVTEVVSPSSGAI